MKILALDLGDVHTGTAISDPNNIIASPLKTVPTKELEKFLQEIVKKENIHTIVIGYPKTLKNKISLQTQKILDFKAQYQQKFPDINWILWDERLTSKSAESFKKSRDKQDKLKLHSIAAALILNNYLEFLRIRKLSESENDSE